MKENSFLWHFIAQFESVENPTHLITIVELPTGAREVMVNTEQLAAKAEYIKNSYDNEMRLKNNPAVRIISYCVA